MNFDKQQALEALKLWARPVIAKAIASTEQKAIEYALRHADGLKDKSGLALDYAMRQYAQATQRVPVLNATQLDDQAVRALLKPEIEKVFAELPDYVKQAARKVVPPVTDAPELPSGEGEQ